CAVPALVQHPVWPLLGCGGRLAGPAFRALLLPGHRVLPAPWPEPLRARRPGRAQARARLPAGGHALAPPGVRSGPARRRGGVDRERGHLAAALSRVAGSTLAVPRMNLHLPRLGADPHAPFPAAQRALDEPNGLLAVGGDLSVPRLLN